MFETARTVGFEVKLDDPEDGQTVLLFNIHRSTSRNAAGPPFPLVWVLAITAVISYMLAMVDPAEVYKIYWCGGMALPADLRTDQLPRYTSSWFEQHVVPAVYQLLHSI